MLSKFRGLLTLGLLALAVPASAQVVINEILPNPGSEFDGAEFIELHNKGASAVNIAGWVLTGTEFDGICGGEDYWQFPGGASIPAGGYIVVAKDNTDPPTEDDDGFLQRFGFDADYELYDAGRVYELDDPAVPNMILLVQSASSFDDQIGLIPGNGYGATCSGTFNRYEALYLYNGDPDGAGTLIDAIEYRDETLCLSDICTGVGNTDDDAFVGLPGVGESLGRDASSGDTGSSDVDLALGTPTPGAVNLPNPGPTLTGLTLSNPDPRAGETVDVSITATDADGIGSMWIVYTVNGGAADSVAMSITGVDQYTGTIPTQSDGDQIAYYVRAFDLGSPVGFSKYPDYSVRRIRWGTQTISSVQFHSPPSDSGFSLEVGNAVNIEGVVTTEPGPFNTTTNNIFTVQSAPGFWNGVHVIDFNGEVQLQRGDSVRVAGTVGEYFGLTQIEIFGQQSVDVLANGATMPPITTTAFNLATGNPVGEALEGVLVHLDDVTVTNDSLGFGEWQISDGTGSCRVDDDAFYLYQPTNGDSLDAIEGIVTYAFSDRKLEPRDDADIQGPPIVSTVRYSPTPPTASTPLVISAEITDNGTITTANLVWSTNNGGSYTTTPLTFVSGSTWQANLGTLPNGTEVDYHVDVVDDSGFPGRSPSAGDYDLYVGFRTIETIQSTFASGTTDSSAFEGSPTNVAGIVTVAPGTIADNLFCIQNTWTTDPAYRGIWVFSGGSLVGQLALGDSVGVSGDVDEYFQNTQIRMHFTEAYTRYGHPGELAAYQLATTDLPRTGPGVPAAGEPWEGVLVIMPNSVVTNASAGFGQYTIDNTAPRTGEETLVDDEGRFGGALTYAPTFGDSISVRGVVEYGFNEFKIQPRNDSDILPYDPADAVGVDPQAATLAFALRQNTPNPFSGPGTRIAFSLPQAADARLRVFDVTGRLVRTLVEGPTTAGSHVVDWNGTNDAGREVVSGVYFYRLEAADMQATRKLILLR